MTVLTVPTWAAMRAAIEENEAQAIVCQALRGEECFTHCHVTVANCYVDAIQRATEWLLLPNPEIPEGFATFYVHDRSKEGIVALLQSIEV